MFEFKPLIIILFMATQFSGFAINDSLQQIIQSKKDTHAVNAYFQLGREYFSANKPDLAISTFLSGDSLAKMLEFDIGHLKLMRALSVAYGRTGDVQKGMELNKEGLALIEKIGAPAIIKVDYLINQGALYYWEDKIGEAIAPYLKAVQLCRQNGFEQKRSMLLNNLGIFYRNLERYDEALTIYKESYEIRVKNEDSLGMANVLHNMSAAYGKIDSLNMAYDVILQSEKLYQLLGQDDDVLLCQLAKGSFLISMDRYEEAYEYLAPLVDKDSLNFDVWHTSNLHLHLAKIYEHREEYGRIGVELDLIEKLLTNSEYVEPLMEYYRLRHLQYKNETNSAKAMSSLEKYLTYFEELNNKQQTKFREEMETKYLSIEKDFQIAQQDIELLRAEKRKNRLLFFALVLFITGAGLIFYLRKQHNFRYQISLKENEIKKDKIIHLEQDQKIIALDYMLLGEENERKRIAKDLHDSLGALLTSAKLQIQKIHQDISKNKDESLFGKAEKIIENAAEEVRRISHDMMPDALVNLGLQAAIEDLINGINTGDHLQVTFHSFDLVEARYSDQIKVGIYRIVQELSQNVIKHAKASQMIIQLTQEENKLQLEVEDNGVGFNPDTLGDRKGIGLNNIESRVKYLSGKLEIITNIGGPTVFRMEFPILNKA